MATGPSARGVSIDSVADLLFAADTDRELAAAAGTSDLLPALYDHLQRADPMPGEQDGTDLYRHPETA